jgi:tetratricopeptide (TPR) repeat protein
MINNATKIKFNKLLKLIENSLAQSNTKDAIKHLLAAHKLEPLNYAVLNELGTCYSNIGDFNKALDHHLKAHQLAKENPIILANIGIDLFKLENFNAAIDILNEALRIDPQNLLALKILISVYHSIGDNNRLCDASIRGITLSPGNFEFHLNLGLGLIGLNKFAEAKYSFETALTLNPQCTEAKLNIAHVLSTQEKHDEAIEIYENILFGANKPHPDLEATIKYNLSYAYLTIGKIQEGWALYDNGLHKSIPFYLRRRPNRSFSIPKWSGQDIGSGTLMVWGEQGLGDEILFMSLIPDLMQKVKNVILECDSRLVKIAQRSFPEFKVRSYSFDADGQPTCSDYDYQIPIGSLNKILRTSISDYDNEKPYLVACNESMHIFDELINANNGKVLIGLCWRSGLITTERSINYIPLEEWDEIFSIPNAVFVNLQYGECEEELTNAEQKFNVQIHRWPSIDLKNDLETVFSLISKLTVVVTAGTAVSSMAFSVGTPTLTFYTKRDWFNLGTDYYPWSCFNKPFFPKDSFHLSDALRDIGHHIQTSYAT